MNKRASPRKKKIFLIHERPPLPSTLKKGALALHYFEKDEDSKGKRGSPSFAVNTGISYGMTVKGRAEKRIYLFATYARTKKDKAIVRKEIASAANDKSPFHFGSLKGAFWFLASVSQKVYEKWGRAIKTGLLLMLYLGLLFFVVQHPELKDIVLKLIEYPLLTQ